MPTIIDHLRTVYNALYRLRNMYPRDVTDEEEDALTNVANMVDAHAALEPDWAAAPEWAQWYAIDADGIHCYFERKPQPNYLHKEWRYDERLLRAAKHEIRTEPGISKIMPIGIDWRLCVWSRPAPEEPNA